jgi:hypothetical protein
LKGFLLMCFGVVKNDPIALRERLLLEPLELEVDFQELLLVVRRNYHAAFLLGGYRN